ncbi:unnamed protein product [Cuscuta campestris]|uniref:Retrovirus-related Pol polyprotein from transposon TNT 1-94-like beta-barrel domain-containing protein n=1 Tax=Cuscuta campestris TaxID=132261 RepID=A0A484KA26_9ASTE|nr:unnamed protein product [Cuscuta campestris]
MGTKIFLLLMQEAAKYPGVWYLDSGCSKHMTGDASLLSNLIPYDGPRVTFGGSNDFGLTKGLGNLVYKGLTNQAVSYVEGLNYNLLSISQFCDKGYSLKFFKDMASLKNISTNEVILTGKRIRNIHKVIWNDVKEACLISKVKEGEVSYIPTHLNLTDLVLEAQRSNPENSTQRLSSSGLDGTEAVGTIAAHFSNENQTEERRNNIRRIKELCGNMQGIREIAESSKRKKH